jgi:DNA invertase Pin-like site-specific DNA recombinase
MATVTVIPAKPMQELKGLEATAKLRVCAYARVSTDNEEQISSYQAQVEHYTSYIKNNPAWEFVEIFSDEGISGTNTKKREGFNRMIEDCMAGKIDMVITKSISRFARNTLDTLKYVRQLKDKGVAIFFEKENVNTLDSKGEFLITLLGSLAQEESSNLSQITKMGISYRFQEGKVLVNHNKFLGYTKDEQGQLVIVPEEAEVVRRIYREFLDGKSPYKIAANLQRDGIITGAGGSRWYDSTVIGILKNEKYQGDALLQKTYTVDFLSKKRVDNNGHAAQYYVEDSHPAIISKEEFSAAQAEFQRRSSMRGYSKTGKSAYTSEYAFSGKLFCQNCGSKFRRSSWGTGKNKKFVWICINHQMNGNSVCDQKAVREKDIEKAFVRAMNGIINGKENFLEKLSQDMYRRLEPIKEECSMEELYVHLEELQEKMKGLVKQSIKAGNVDENGHSVLSAEIEKVQNRMKKLIEQQVERTMREKRVEELRDYLIAQESGIDKFDDVLFRRFVEKVMIQSMAEVAFVFKVGVDVREVL